MTPAREPQAPEDRPGLITHSAIASEDASVSGALAAVDGAFVTLEGEACYRIGASDALPPFLMNLPSDTDLWMFISSAGGLTAGRRDPDGALFPYETVDKLHDAHHHTGPITLLRVTRRDGTHELWEPFAAAPPGGRTVERALYKSVTGHQLTFEETEPALGLTFRYRWAASDATGWVRTATLEHHGSEPFVITLLDGLRNLLPSGAPLALYQHSSCLVDAYKRVDLDPETGLGIFSLTASVSDRPEPSESLRCTTVWGHGLPNPTVALAAGAIAAFRAGERLEGERVLTGRRGNYLVAATLALEPGARARWHLAADAGRSHVQVAALRARLAGRATLPAWLDASLRGADENLRRIVGSADGLQVTGRDDVAARHYANVLFNVLRGGVFVRDHNLPGADFAMFVHTRDPALASRHAALLAGLPAELPVEELHRVTAESGDPALRRLGMEYLPLFFGRRHGDPSRPWNRFSIDVRNPDGSRALRFEGNWRDVFQNWEALTLSFPGFLPGVIARFVNASTVDGFNPYRITREGFDWEVLDRDSPWSGIGYWGDHQIVYLCRLLESLAQHQPGALEGLLAKECFSYADVPYRLAPYARILAEPRRTIRYDEARAAEIATREAVSGRDARLVRAADGSVLHVSLLEKLVVPVLAKLSNFVPAGGIWMNTERPEWNDANNALVGHGLSVVTLCQLRRHLEVLERLLAGAPEQAIPVSVEVVAWLRRLARVFTEHREALAAGTIDDGARRQVMDELGLAFEAYREPVYARGFAGKEPLAASEVRECFAMARTCLEHTIRANCRDDGLYHAYNLLELSADGGRAAIRRLPEMLEGQVAVLGSGLVSPGEAAELMSKLFASRLYRPDALSFLLYPDVALPTFLERNVVPEAPARALPLVAALLAAGDTTILERDAQGVLRFHGDFKHAGDVATALDRLARNATWSAAVAQDAQAVCELFVDVFGHRTFTGRSGRMYAYEGLGCIYWHMVAKLLLAVQESALGAFEADGNHADRAALVRAYYRVRAGFGFERSPREFGAFPTDPYSHTPAHAGAQQPGMTGEVKEEILTRFGEFGVRVEDGLVRFHPVLLRREEFRAEDAVLRYFGAQGDSRLLAVPAGTLAFTYAKVPVRYCQVEGSAWVRVTWRDRRVRESAGNALDRATSEALLRRSGELTLIEVGVPQADLL